MEEERRVHPEGCDVGVNTELERCCFCPQSAVQWREKVPLACRGTGGGRIKC